MASKPVFALSRLLHSLTRADVDFVVIGGVAVIVQGSPRFTKDLDISYATDDANLEKLGGLLVGLDARLREIEEDLPFVADANTLRHAQMLTLATREGDIDLLVDPPGSPGYRALARKADRIELNGDTVLIAAIDDLIAMKTAAGRPQDVVDLESLQVVRRRMRSKR